MPTLAEEHRELSTRQLVFMAADSLRRQREKPTPKRVMEMIGRGSKTTVLDALGDWWEAALDKMAEEHKPDGVSDDAYHLAQQLYQLLRKSAEGAAREEAREEYETERQKYATDIRVAREAAEAAERTREVALDRAEREAERREVLERQLARAMADSEAVKEKLAQTRAQNDALMATLVGKEEVIAGLAEAKRELTSSMVKQEQTANQREAALQRQLQELLAERADRERRWERETEERAQAQASLRELLVSQRADAERERAGLQKVIEERDALLASLRQELDNRAAELQLAAEEATELRSSLQDLERVVAQQQQAIAAAVAQTAADGGRIRELERRLAEAAGKDGRE